MSPELILTIGMFSALIAAIMCGVSLGFAMGGVAVVTAYIMWGTAGFFPLVSGIFKYMWMIELAAVPLFVFMGVALSKSGVARDMYDAFYLWSGALRGGLAVGSCGFAAALSAMTGNCSAATVTAGLVGIPPMRARGYQPDLIFGTVCSSGTLGILIPPSITLIIIGMMTGESIGKLFAGGLTAGLFVAFCFMAYILIRAWLQPHIAPAREEKASFKEKLEASKSVVLPGLVVIAVLGSIFFGVATPTEAASLGCVAVFLCVLIRREVTWFFITDVIYNTATVSGMVLWIMFGASGFICVYCGGGGAAFIQQSLMSMDIGPWGVFWVTMGTVFILGMFLDPVGIILLVMPIFYPVIKKLGFDPIWYGVIFQLNLCMGYITPPFGYNIFYIKTLSPETPIGVIYKSVFPFVAIMIASMFVMVYLPDIITWLPKSMGTGV